MHQGLAERIRQVMALDPQAGAIDFHESWYSWGEVAAVMNSIDRQLAQAGLGEGDVVGVVLRNRPGTFSAALQILASRRCLVTINPFQGAEKIAADLRSLRLPVVIADPQDWEVPSIRDAVAASGALGVSVGSMPASMTCAPVPGLEKSGSEFHEPLPGTCILMLTSGTTGPAKRIQLPYRNFERALLDAAIYEQKKDGGDLQLKTSAAILSTPLVHIGGMYFGIYNVASGRPFALLEKFTVDAWRNAVVRHRPKVASLPPTAIRMVLDAELARDDLASLLAIRAGSAPLDPDMAERFEAVYGVPILDVYGATEFAGAVAGWSVPDHKKFGKSKRGSVGRAQPGTELRVVDQVTGEVLPGGSVGVLEVKTAQVDASNWTRTTDLAEIDSDGFLFLRGRADDAIIRGGFKILPPEVENAIRKHPSVKDVCVVGVPDERLGAVPVAAIELYEEAPPATAEELLAEARKHLVSYQVPVKAMVTELPRTPSMKVSKHEVRQLFGASK